MKQPIFIYGAGGLGREVLALIHALDQWEVRGFLDDSVTEGTLIKGLTVIGGMKRAHELGAANVAVAIGDPGMKEKIVLELPPLVSCPVLIHPRATIMDASSVRIGKGTIIASGATLTTDISVGEHVLINLNATVGHDTAIGSFSSVMPGVNIAGEVTIGHTVLLGSGSNIRNAVHVGNNSKVGMGAVVIKNVREKDTVIGVPARPV